MFGLQVFGLLRKAVVHLVPTTGELPKPYRAGPAGHNYLVGMWLFAPHIPAPRQG